MTTAHRLACAFGVLIATAFSSPLLAGQTTSPAAVSCAPEDIAKRTAHSMAYDARRQRVVVFGGSTADAAHPYPSSLWGWDGRVWRCLSASGPPGRIDAFLEFDAARNRLVLFGGRRLGPNRTSEYMKDTWEWDGTAWTLRDSNGPAPRIHGAAVYDATRRTVVIHGGGGQSGPLDDTWEWTGSVWRALPLTMPFVGNGDGLVSTPQGVVMIGAARDSAPGCAGLERAVLYRIDRDRLTDLRAPGPCFSPHAPMTATSDGILLFAGWPPNAAPAESWLWRDGRWQRTASTPTRRRGTAIAYDAQRHRVVLFGGTGDAGLLGDLWEFDGIEWAILNGT